MGRATKRIVLKDKAYEAVWKEAHAVVKKAMKLKKFGSDSKSELIIMVHVSNIGEDAIQGSMVSRCTGLLKMTAAQEILN